MNNRIKYCLIKETPNDESILSTGTVESFVKDEILVAVKEAEVLKLEKEAYINIFGDGNGICRYKGVIKNIQNNIVTLNIKQLVEYERRHKKRIIVKIPINISTIKMENEEIIHLDKPILMIGRNLSVEGLLLETKLNIPMEVRFLVRLPIDGNDICLETSTKRKYQKDNMYFYGCEFRLKDKDKERVLRKFISKNNNNKVLDYYK